MTTKDAVEAEGYGYLLAGILRQTVIDYILTKRRIMNGQRVYQRHNLARRLESCEEFFKDPPYDYGDIDFKQLKTLCDEKVIDGTRIFTRDFSISRWTEN